jgi:hypothetical protein
MKKEFHKRVPKNLSFKLALAPMIVCIVALGLHGYLAYASAKDILASPIGPFVPAILFAYQAQIQLLFNAAIATHLLEAIYTLKITKFQGPWLQWFLQTFIAGFGSITLLGKQTADPFAKKASNCGLLFLFVTVVTFVLNRGIY